MDSANASRSLTRRKLELLDSLLARQGGPQSREGIVMQRADSRQHPLSFAQQRIWFLDQLEPGPHYNDPFHLRLKGELDVTTLQAALQEIVRRHEALRAHFETVAGQPRQRIQPASQISLSVTDLSDLDGVEREQRARRMAFEDGQGEFKLEHGPLFRARIVRLARTEHLLLLTFHHIAMDGWSRSVFLQELAALYQAFGEGKPSPLPELTIQYADFAAWQRDQMTGENLDQHLAFWRQQLHGIPSLLEWPTDYPRPARQCFQGARQEVRIDRTLTDELKELSRQRGCTLFMTLLAAFQIVAMRHTGQEDVVIGCPIANRNRAEIEKLIGYFLNTLVLRGDLSGEPSFIDLLARTRERALAAFAHQDLPYERLVEELNPARDASYNSIFQTMFIFQNTPPPPLRAGALTISPFEVHNGSAKLDLTLNLSETSEGLTGWFEYATNLFAADSITQLRAQFEVLLQEIVRNPGRRITHLPLLTEAEQRQFLQWNDTRRNFSSELCVHELFEAQAAETPAAVAARFEGRQLSYHELDERASQLAHRLKHLGVQPEMRVGILVDRSLEMLVSVLGVLKSGGAYVPLDPLLPRGRLAFILEDAGIQILITEKGGLRSPEFDGPKKVKLVEAGSGPLKNLALLVYEDAWPSARPFPAVTAENLAYLIYTSGSTGRPKGVQITHRSVVNLLESVCSVLPITAADTLLAVTTLSFDIAVLELLAPLAAGGCVAIAPREVAMDGKRLAAALETSHATIMQATPTTWRLLLAAGWNGRKPFKALCGGEAWQKALADPLLRRCTALWNMYGPTETTVWSAIQQITTGDDVLVGKPLANTQFHVLDRHLQPASLGVAGELCIGGEGLARGYWRRPELTAEKFVPHPFAAHPNARLYKTGDLVRYRADGRIEFLGRIDHQVKIRGHRVETGEVEALLARHPAVRECVVDAQPDASGENRLVAYLVLRGAEPPEAQEWRRHLNGHLPDYMLPACFILLPNLPLNPNGKINRRELPRPEAVAQPTTPSALLNPVQAKLAAIWCDVLGLARVDADDNFFELGGHSLMVTQAIARIRQTLGVDFSMRAFFEAPTVAAVAAGVEARMNGASPR